uniref:C3H1-type domain-containing protein n=1 Tax=Haemonchus contortus TaxID=6289 RepID=A0A7I4Y8X7_HAECO
MFYYPEGPLPQLSRNRGSFSSPSMRPMSSLSSGSTDSDIYGIHPPPPSSVVPPPPSLSSSTSRPPSPGLQITHLLHQTANLLAVNAQLRKEIEQVRSGVTSGNLASVGASSAAGGAVVPPSPVAIPSPLPTAAKAIAAKAGAVTPAPLPLSSLQQQAKQNHPQQQFLQQLLSIGGGSLALDYEMPYPHDNSHHYNNNQHNGRSAAGKKAANPDSYKTVMCQAWLESKMCAFGENCRFAHGEAELRPVRSVPCQINKYKTKLCDKYTTTGLCPYGDRCLFIHPDHGTNAYIRPDKLVEVSRRHALADMQFLASMDAARGGTPPSVGQLPGQPNPVLAHILPPPSVPLFPPRTTTNSVTTACGRSTNFGGGGSGVFGPNGQARTQLRPHPSWPLEPSTFFKEKTDEFRTPSPDDAATLASGKGSWDELSTPARSSCGYVSGGSTPSGASPFSTVSSSSLHLNLTDDDRDFDLFNLTVGFDHIAQDLAKTLELW